MNPLHYGLAALALGGCGAQVVFDSPSTTEFCERYCAAYDACAPDMFGDDCIDDCVDTYDRQGDPSITCGPRIRRTLSCMVEAFQTSGCDGFPNDVCAAERDAATNCP